MDNEKQNYLSILQELPLKEQRKIFDFVEFLFYEANYPEFTVLIHKYELKEKGKEKGEVPTFDYEQMMIWLMHIPQSEHERIHNLIRFLKIKYSTENSLDNFLTFYDKECADNLSSDDRNELKRRLKEIQEHPEIGVPWEKVVQNLETRIGKKIKLSS